jgi:hypothetical protein
MLLSAFRGESSSVSADLLTYADLAALKRGRCPEQPPEELLRVDNNKRYLILTYASEFDRVHYPLPLQYEENPDPQHLKVGGALSIYQMFALILRLRACICALLLSARLSCSNLPATEHNKPLPTIHLPRVSS